MYRDREVLGVLVLNKHAYDLDFKNLQSWSIYNTLSVKIFSLLYPIIGLNKKIGLRLSEEDH